MKYQVISAKTCPYVQRVMILLEEKGLEYTHATIDLKNKPSWFEEISPLGKVPLLKLADSTVLFESQAINEYLDETEGPALQPESMVSKAQNRAWTDLISKITMSFGGYYYASDKLIMEDRLQTVKGYLAQLETSLDGGPYFNGPAFSLIDAAAAPLFSRIELLNQYHEIDLLAPHSRLTAWSQALLKHPSVKRVTTEAFQQQCLQVLKDKQVYIAQFLPENK
jgi:glutathione S-transferase